MNRLRASPNSFTASVSLLTVLLVIACAWLSGTGLVGAEECSLPLQNTEWIGAVKTINLAWRCRLSAIMRGSVTGGVVTGPVHTPLPAPLYTYFLDHPAVTASLMQRLHIAPYHARMYSPTQFWVNDGEGTQGLVTILYQDATTRIYHIEGVHEGHLLPVMRGQAVVFLSTVSVEGRRELAAVDTTLMSYMQLDNRTLSSILSLFKPLIGEAITRRLTRVFGDTDRLSQVIAQGLDQVLQHLLALPPHKADDLASLTALLRSVQLPALVSP